MLLLSILYSASFPKCIVRILNKNNHHISNYKEASETFLEIQNGKSYELIKSIVILIAKQLGEE